MSSPWIGQAAVRLKWPATQRLLRCGALLLVLFLTAEAEAATTRAWNQAAGGNWNTATNWTPNGVPAAGDTAQINAINAGATINLTANSNAVILTIATNNSFTISGSRLSITALTDSAAAGTHTISAPVTMTANNIWNINTGVSLAVSGVLAGNFALTKTGGGIVMLSGANTFGGGKVITISGGVLSIDADARLGANTNTLSIAGGTLQSTGTFTSARAIAVGAGDGAIDVAAGSTLTLSGVISGANSLVKTDTGTLTLSGANTFGAAGEAVTVNDGVLSINSDARLGNANNVVNLAGGTLQTTATLTSARSYVLAADSTVDVTAGTLTLSGAISGANSLTKTSAGALTLSGANTFGGNNDSLTIAAGTLSISAAGQLGDPTNMLVLNDGTTFTITAITNVTNPVTFGAGATGITINIPNNTTSSTPITMTGAISGGGAGQTFNLTGNSDAWLYLAGANTYVANLVMANATNLEFNSDASFGDAANTVTLTNNNAVAAVGGTTFAGNRAITINNSFFLADANTFWINSGVVSGPTLNVGYSDAAGSFTGTVELSGNNTFTGTINVWCGTLALANNNALGAPTSITVNGTGFNRAAANAALMIDGNVTIPQNITTVVDGASTNTIGSLSGTTGTFSGTVTMGSATFFAAAQGSTVTFSNTISGAFAITAGSTTATGTLYFTAANTYTGTTTVAGGTLQLKGDTATLATTGLTLNFGGTFDIDASGAANPNRIPDASPVTFNGGTFSIEAPANTDRTETVGQLTFASGDSAVTLTPNGTGRTRLAGTGTLARIAGATLNYTRNTGGGTGLAHLTATTQAAGTVNWATVNGSSAAYDTTNAADGIVNGLTLAAPIYTSQVNGPWNTPGTWTPAGPPTANSVAIVQNNVSVNAAVANTPFAIDIIAGGSLTTTSGPQALPVGAGGIVVPSGVTTSIGSAAGGAGQLNVQSGTSELIVATIGSANLTINNVINNTNTPALTKSGSGTLTLMGANLYTGATTINNGTLLVDGSIAAGSAVSLNGGTLGGTGTVNGTVTAAANGGTIDPGDPTINTGILKTGAVTLNASSSYEIQLNGTTAGTGYDQLNVTGAINLGSSTLDAVVGAAFLPNNGQTFTIITSTGAVSGTFSGLANNAIFPISGQNFKITYNANSVVLTRVIGTYTWNGAGINNNWSTGFNWVGGVAPGIGDSLLFGAAGAARKTTNLNNIAAGTSFNSIQFQSAGYILNGNSVTLTGGATALNDSATAGVNTINNNIAFSTAAPTITCFNGGTLNIAGTVDNNGLLVTVASAGMTVLSNVISDTGGLTSSGAGTVVLTGNNTYSGATTISAGTLQVGNSGVSGSLGTAAVTDNAALVFKRTDSPVISNGISGTGALTQAGSDTLILTGANTYSGTTTISAGTLQIGNAGTAGTLGTGSITDNSALVFNRTDALSIANAIGGTGSLTQAGSGTLTLSAAETYTGATNINAGTLIMNGSLAAGAGLTTVNPGATLGGSGTVQALSIANGGFVAPGVAGISTLNAGNTAIASGGTYNVDINSATSDQINVTGTVNVSTATLSINTLAGFAPTAGAVLTIINNDGADAVTGTFTGMPEGTLLLTNGYGFQLSYVGGTGNDVVLKHVPIVQSITTASANPTNAPSITYTVTFSEPVKNVTTADFALAVTGGIAGASVASVSPSSGLNSSYTVTVNTGTIPANGTIGLNLVDRDTITDSANVKLGGTGTPPPAGGAGDGSFTGAVYTIHYFTVTGVITQDTNSDGLLDTIQITTNLALSDDFSDLNITVTAGAYTYTLTGTPYTTGTTGNDNVFLVNLTPQLNLLPNAGDTGNTPTVALTANTKLTENGVAGVILRSFSITALDKAPPVLISAQWVDASNPGVSAFDTILFIFSEPVSTSGAISVNDFKLPVTGDTFDPSSSIGIQGPSTSISMTLLGNPVLTPGGTYLSTALTAGSASGTYVFNGANVLDAVGQTAVVQNTATAVDIQPTDPMVAVSWNDATFTIAAKTWALGAVSYGANKYIASDSFLPNELQLRNTGNVRESFIFSCTNSAPSNWTLAAAPALNKFSMLASFSPPNNFTADLSGAVAQRTAGAIYSGQSQNFDLQYVTPTTINTGQDVMQTITVTITAQAN